MNTSSRIVTRVVLAALAAGALLMAAPDARASTLPILLGHLKADPVSGPAGSMVSLKGTDFWPGRYVTVEFLDSNGGQIVGAVRADGNGRFTSFVCVPANASGGSDSFYAESAGNRAEGSTGFTVTPRLATDRSARSAPGSICVRGSGDS